MHFEVSCINTSTLNIIIIG